MKTYRAHREEILQTWRQPAALPAPAAWLQSDGQQPLRQPSPSHERMETRCGSVAEDCWRQLNLVATDRAMTMGPQWRQRRRCVAAAADDEVGDGLLKLKVVVSCCGFVAGGDESVIGGGGADD